MKTDTYNVNNNPPGSPHEVRRAPRAQPTSALRAHTPCWLAMAWSFLNCSSTFSTIFIRAASRRYSSAVCLLELMSLRCSSVRASGRLPHLRPRSGRKKSKDGQEAHSKLKKEVKKGSGSVRMARSIIPAMPRCSPGGRASSPQGASPQCASSHDCGTHLSGTVWLGRNMLLSWSPQCAQPSSLYTITCHGPRQGCGACAQKLCAFPQAPGHPITGEQRFPGQARRGRAF